MTVALIAAVAAARASEIALSKNASTKVARTPPTIQRIPEISAPTSASATPM
jgi:hypothetical protein